MSPKKSAQNTKKTAPVRSFWEQLSWGDITDHFGDRTTQRGRGYDKGGNVKSLWATDDGENLFAVVRGSDDYHTSVSLSKKKDKFSLRSSCSCPVGINCKHGVATIAKYLGLLASSTPVPRCVKKSDEIWEVFSADGKKNTMTIDEYDDDDEDDWDDWDDDDDSWDEDDWDDSPPARNTKTAKKVKTLAKDDQETVLKKKLQAKSQKELTDLVLLLFHEYDVIREHFEREAFAESVAKTGDIAKLVEKAIKLIDKAFGNASYRGYGRRGRYDRYDDGPSFDLTPVHEIIRQFLKFDDPLPAIDQVARHLIKKGTHFIERTGARDTDGIDYVFHTIAEVLLKSKGNPVKSILWAHEISHVGDYDFGGYAMNSILDRAWPIKVWSGVADEMINSLNAEPEKQRSSRGLRTIVQTLDKANRQKEATDLLRKEAPKASEFRMLVDRLIEVNLFDEAEKIIHERRQAQANGTEKQRGYYHDSWPDCLKVIAEKRKDWPTLASIQAVEFFAHPWRDKLKVFLSTVKKIKGIEPAVRKSIEEFLQSGEFPAVVQKSLKNEKPCVREQEHWPVSFFSFKPDTRRSGPLFDVLCEWAIDEGRPNDVVKWYDEHLKNKTPRSREINHGQVADAICKSHPDRAFRIYRNVAEHEMEVTRQYPMAVRTLRKARQALELSGRGGDWSKVMEEIRTTHRRKSSLMKELDELETPSIIQQKRRGR